MRAAEAFLAVAFAGDGFAKPLCFRRVRWPRDAAARIGDDTLQRQSQGYVVPDSFTHGSAEQRSRWFRQGYDQGVLDACDTFGPDRV